MRRWRRLGAVVALVCVLGSTLATGIVEAAPPTTKDATPAGVIPPGPQPKVTKPSVPTRSDLVFDPTPTVADLKGLSGDDLAKAALKNPVKPGDGRHKNPKAGDDPRDPATVRINTGAWLLFFTDSAGNLYQQQNPGTALDPYWQSGNVIANGSVSGPDVVRLDSGSDSTLGLFYLRNVGGRNQVMERASTTNGASWSTETQITSATTSLYMLRSLVVSGTVYLFWSDNSGGLFYSTSTDLSTWAAPLAVGHTVGVLTENGLPAFDIAHLANGTWILAYLAPIPGWDYWYTLLSTAIGTDLQTWGAPIGHNDWVGGRWPRAMSLVQAANGTLYLAYVRYEYPWAYYVRFQTGNSSGTSWSGDTLFGCDRAIGCDGGHGVTTDNPYLFLDEQNHVQALWQMSAGPAGANVPDPYPDQLFEADLTTGTYYRPLPPYMDPSVNYGAGSVGSGLVNIASGNLVVSESDYTLGGLGLPTTITRTYNGGDTRDGIFGYGWSFPYAMGLQVNANASITIANFDGRRDYYTESGGTYTAPPGLETTLVHNGSGTWTLSYRDHTTKTFDANGKLTGETDTDGNATTLAYSSGRLSTITDAAGRTFTFGYNGDGRVTSISIPLTRSLGYGYDTNGNLTSFTDAAGAVTTYGYGSDHMLTSVTDASGRVSTVGWTTLRRIKSVTDPAGAVTSYAYGDQSASGGSTSVTDARGTVTTHTYDARGRQTQISVAMPGTGNNLVTSFAYNTDDQVTSQTDPRGVVTTFQYDGHGNVTQKVVDAGTGKLNLTTGSVYTNDDLTQTTDPRGTVTDYTYDTAHHLLTKTVHLDGGVNLVTTNTYYGNGLLHTTKDPVGQTSGNQSTLTYDANGYVATATNAAGDTVTTSYDAGGRLSWSRDGRNKQTDFTYDNADRQLTVTDPLGHTTTSTYNLDGEKTSVTDAEGVIATTTYSRSGEAVASSADTGSTGFAVANPGFELGAARWTAAGSPSIVTTPILTGAKAAKVTSTATYSQEIPVVAGKPYGITAYAMGTAAGQTARLTYTWRNAAHATLATGNVDVAVSTSGFLPVALAPTTAPASSAYLLITLASTASGDNVVFDDVVPTTSTLTDYDAAGNKTSVLDALGHITRYGYDAASRLVSTTDARGKTTTYTLDKDGNQTRVSDPLGHNVDAVYDNANRKTSSTVDPGGLALVTSQTYDADGNVATTTDPDHHTTSFTYDRANRLTTVLDAASGTTTYGYDANGNRTSVTDARNKTTHATYDPVNRVLTSTDALTHVTTFGYDHAGNTTSRLDANGVTASYTYDDAERNTAVSYSSGGSVAFTYDNVGRRRTMTDATGTTTWTYDHFGRITEVDAPSRSAVTYTYDAVGNRASITTGSKTVSYTYNETNALASVTDWLSRTTSYAYDDAGRPASVSYPNTIAAAYTIDNAGRVTNLAYTKSGNAFAAYGYTFNGEGQRLTESAPEGSTTYAYDNLGRLTSAAYPANKSDAFGYDAVGNRTSLVHNGVSTTYAYDDANEITSATTAGVASTYAYDLNGNRTSVTTPPTVDTTAPSVPANLTASAVSATEVDLSWSASSDNIAVASYRIYRDATLIATVSGSATSFADVTTTGSTTYAYTVAAVDSSGNTSAASDADNATTPSGTPPTDTTAPSVPTGLSESAIAGGRIDLAWSASTDDVAVAGYNVYRDGTKLTSVPNGSTSYTDTGVAPGVNHTYTVTALDAAANESASSSGWTGAASSDALSTTYAYDAENRLTALTQGGSSIGAYAYDGAGDRTSKTTAAGTTAYTLDLASALPQVISETTGSATTAYAYAGGPLELDKAGTTYWYQSDTLGSVRLLTDASGNSASSYNYSAFGATRTSSGSIANEVRFSGERTDTESGLEFLRARTYDPSTGTFLQRDSWGITPTDGQSLDVYAYTQNDPNDRVDPSGHCWGICIDIKPPSLPIPDLSAAAHVALGAATFVPGIGTAAAVADAGLYAYEGDYAQAALSLTAVVPGGAILSHGEQALKFVSDADKVANAVSDVNKIDKVVTSVDKAESAVNDVNKIDKVASSGFGGLSQAADYGIQSYSKLRSSLQDTLLQAHHLFEKRFADVMEESSSEMLSVAVTKEEHQAFTNAWRHEIGYGAGTRSATRESVEAAARKVYTGYPSILRGLRL